MFNSAKIQQHVFSKTTCTSLSHKLPMLYQDGNNVGRVKRNIQRDQFKGHMRFDIGLNSHHVITFAHQRQGNVYGRRLSQVVDIRLEGQAQTGNARLFVD